MSLRHQLLIMLQIQINTWYYVSMVFKKKNNGDSIWLYVMTVAESADCENNCNCPDHVASNTRSPTGKSSIIFTLSVIMIVV